MVLFTCIWEYFEFHTDMSIEVHCSHYPDLNTIAINEPLNLN